MYPERTRKPAGTEILLECRRQLCRGELGERMHKVRAAQHGGAGPPRDMSVCNAHPDGGAAQEPQLHVLRPFPGPVLLACHQCVAAEPVAGADRAVAVAAWPPPVHLVVFVSHEFYFRPLRVRSPVPNRRQLGLIGWYRMVPLCHWPL